MLGKNIKALPSDYVQLNRFQKLELLWQNILDSAYPLDDLPIHQATIKKEINLLRKLLNVKGFSSKTLTCESDEMPDHRQRLVHRYGSVAKVRYQSTNSHPFTGLFATDTIGLLRASIALSMKVTKKRNFIPGVGFKFLIDHSPSENILALYSLDGQGKNYNFFENTLSNIIPTPRKILFRFLSKYLSYFVNRYLKDPAVTFLTLPLDRLAMQSPDGTLPPHPLAPYKIMLEPMITLSKELTPDFRIKLNEIEIGTLIYKIYAQETQDSEKIHIANMITESKFIPSFYGDHILFFQHSRSPKK